jgi:hypothetical protein
MTPIDYGAMESKFKVILVFYIQTGTDNNLNTQWAIRPQTSQVHWSWQEEDLS